MFVPKGMSEKEAMEKWEQLSTEQKRKEAYISDAFTLRTLYNFNERIMMVYKPEMPVNYQPFSVALAHAIHLLEDAAGVERTPLPDFDEENEKYIPVLEYE